MSDPINSYLQAVAQQKQARDAYIGALQEQAIATPISIQSTGNPGLDLLSGYDFLNSINKNQEYRLQKNVDSSRKAFENANANLLKLQGANDANAGNFGREVAQEYTDKFATEFATQRAEEKRQQTIADAQKQAEILRANNAPQSVIDQALKPAEQYAKSMSNVPLNMQDPKVRSAAEEEIRRQYVDSLPFYDRNEKSNGQQIFDIGAMEAKHANMEAAMQEFLDNEKRNNFSGASFADVEKIQKIGDDDSALAKYLVEKFHPYTANEKADKETRQDFDKLYNKVLQLFADTKKKGKDEDNKLSNQDIALSIIGSRDLDGWGTLGTSFWDAEGKLVGQGISAKGAMKKWQDVKKYIQDYRLYEQAYNDAISKRNNLRNYDRVYQDALNTPNAASKQRITDIYRGKESDFNRSADIYTSQAKTIYDRLNKVKRGLNSQNN